MSGSDQHTTSGFDYREIALGNVGTIGERVKHLVRFYSILNELEEKVGGARKLCECSGRLPWPRRGVYFFREEGEQRRETGRGPRIVRVGTHALKESSTTRLWDRLSQHRGQTSGGNHRGSIFRLIVGSALIRQQNQECSTWEIGNTAGSELRRSEQVLECEVSKVIGAMPFLWLSVNDKPGPSSVRGYIERNVIALLSNYKKHPVDPSSKSWLGRSCNRERVRDSGLWNSNHVEESYDPAFLDVLSRLVSEVGNTL